MDHFRIHPQLLDDCHRLGRLPACHLLLHRNAAVPWFILVPETEAEALHLLPGTQRAALLHDASAIAGYLTGELGWPRINVAAIGNVVPQLHLHVVGRRPGDACWPAPVWGNLPAGERYDGARLAAIRTALAARHGLSPEA